MHKKGNNLTRKQAEIRSANISNISYIINLDLEKNSSQYIGKTLISFEYRNEKLNELVIDFITKLIKYIKLNGKITCVSALSLRKTKIFQNNS